MSPVMAYLSISRVLADAVFVPGMQRCADPSAGQVRHAAAAAIQADGRSGCAGHVAQEFGDHPETVVIRMRGAREVSHEASWDLLPELDLGDAGGSLVIRPRLPDDHASGLPRAWRREPARSVAGTGRPGNEGWRAR
jgi:hypothetical protein